MASANVAYLVLALLAAQIHSSLPKQSIHWAVHKLDSYNNL